MLEIRFLLIPSLKTLKSFNISKTLWLFFRIFLGYKISCTNCTAKLNRQNTTTIPSFFSEPEPKTKNYISEFLWMKWITYTLTALREPFAAVIKQCKKKAQQVIRSSINNNNTTTNDMQKRSSQACKILRISHWFATVTIF